MVPSLADLLGLKDKKYPGRQKTAVNSQEEHGSKLPTEQTPERDLPTLLLLEFKDSRNAPVLLYAIVKRLILHLVIHVHYQLSVNGIAI